MKAETLALALCLLSMAAAAAPPGLRVTDRRDLCRPDRRSRFCATGGSGDPALFRLLDVAGTGAGSISTNMCATFGGELTGASAFCEQNAGASSAGIPLTNVGSPIFATPSVCPNGPNCGDLAVWNLDSTNFRTTGVEPSLVASSFSVCWFGRKTSFAGTSAIWTKSDFVGIDVLGNVFGNIAPSAPNAVPGTPWHAICYTYENLGAGSSVGKLYINNGTAAATSNTLGTPNVNPGFHRIGDGDGYQLNWIFFTEKTLSASIVTSMMAALNPTLTGTRGEAIAFNRASTAYVPASNGTLINVRSNIPRVTNHPGFPALLVEGTATNLLLHGRDLTQPFWVKTNMSCTLIAIGMEGLNASASRCSASAANGTVLQGVTVAAATRTSSLYIKRVTGSGNIDITRNNGTTWTTLTSAQCADIATGAAAAINSSAYVRCQLASSVLNPTIGLRFVVSGDSADIDFVQDEAKPYATSPILTAGTSATRAAEDVSTAKPSGVGDSLGCWGANLFWVGADTSNRWPLAWDSGTRGAFLPSGSSSLTVTDGTSATVAIVSPFGRPIAHKATWATGGNKSNITDGLTTTNAYGGNFTGGSPTLYIGAVQGPIAAFNGYLGNIRLGDSLVGCDQ